MQELNMVEVDAVGGAVSWQGIASFTVGAAAAAGCVLVAGATAPAWIVGGAAYAVGYGIGYLAGS